MNRHVIIFAATIAAACFAVPCAAQISVGHMDSVQGTAPSNDDSMQSKTLDLINREALKQKR